MISIKRAKIRLVKAIFGCFFGILGLILPIFASNANVYADEEEPTTNVTTTVTNEETNENTNENTNNDNTRTNPEEKTEEEEKKPARTCDASLGSLGWLVCPTTGKISEAVDWLYAKNKDMLEINPVKAEEESPIYQIWNYFLGVANLVFVIFLLVVVWSQITGVGINNYGVKKALPKLIIAAIMVNLSFLVCSLAVDLSNIIGNGLRGVFTTIEEATVPLALSEEGYATAENGVAMTELYGALAGGSGLVTTVGFIAFEGGEIWMLIPAVLGALVSVVVGLITIALRQVVVILLIMIAPLAIVACILPNTESLFKKWKNLLVKMLVFYPMYSLLFGASSLAGWAIIASAHDGFGLILGTAVKIFPLFFSWSLMKMSGTFLGTVNAKITGFFAKPIAATGVWAQSQAANTRANTLANGVTPTARLRQYMEKRRVLREEDTKNAMEISASRSSMYAQRKIADSEIGDTKGRSSYTSRYTRNAKGARVQSLMAKNAVAHTEHVMDEYGSYFDNDARDRALNTQSQNAWIDAGRAAYQRDIDEENDINFLIDRYLAAVKRDKNGEIADPVAFQRYMASVAGPDGEERLSAKIIAQAAKVESKQRAEFNILYAKYGHNGYNKREFRDWALGYRTDDDGWALGLDGKRLKNADGSFVEIVQGDALTKAPEKLVLYDKRDEYGLYYDFKDQDGNVIARLHRGTGDDGNNHDDAAFIKETLGNYDIPIADPINNIYSILSGIRAPKARRDADGNIMRDNDGHVIVDSVINTPQGQNEIGLARYSTTIGRAMKDYKGNAAWAGAMFNSGIGNRQIKNSAQHAIWVLDSIVKTLKPGAFNTQNPASVKYIRSIFDPDNWDKIFTEDEILDACNINNKLLGGEDWTVDENGMIIDYTPVENPNYEQRMNTIKRKLLFPAMKKVLPAFDRLRTSNTADNQKPGTADEQYEFLKMVEEKWENNPAINFDPTLVDQDLPSEAREFRKRKHDKDGNLLYAEDRSSRPSTTGNLYNDLEELYDRCLTAEQLKDEIFRLLNSNDRYSAAIDRFDDLWRQSRGAADMNEMRHWFQELDTIVSSPD